MLIMVRYLTFPQLVFAPTCWETLIGFSILKVSLFVVFSVLYLTLCKTSGTGLLQGEDVAPFSF